MTKNIPGQGSFEFEQTNPNLEVQGIDISRRFATSALIKHIAEVRDVSPAEVDSRFMDFISPALIESGIYLPKGKTDRDIDTAMGPVIFPASEYKVLSKSPVHIAFTASAGVKKARHEDEDKESVEKASKRASGHALGSQKVRADELLTKLKNKEDALKLIKNEIVSAKGTGFFAHYSAEKMLPLIGLAEEAIFDALNVTATTGGWNEYQYKEAKKALNYQLFGLHDKRYSYWRQYAPLVYNYTRKRRLVVGSTIGQLERELKKYQTYITESQNSE